MLPGRRGAAAQRNRDPGPRDRLDDLALLEAADPGGVLRQVASAAAQVRTARATAETDLEPVISAGRPRSIVVVGMGGSGVAGEVLAAVCRPGSASLVIAQHDYRLPGWVGAADLVVAVSCSGTTEETLSAAEEAVRRGCPLLAVGGAGSPLAQIAEQASAPFIPVESAACRVLRCGAARPADDRGTGLAWRTSRRRARGGRRGPGAGLAPAARTASRSSPRQDAGPGAGRRCP